MFYTNDLSATPSQPILGSDVPESVFCVQGLAPLNHWTGGEVLHRTILMVPAFVTAYNIFMNAVDRMDQHRSTNPTRRKEKRLPMTIFTLLLDLSVHNAYALHKVLEPSRQISYREFKWGISEKLVEAHLLSRNRRPRREDGENSGHSTGPGIERMGDIMLNHMLLENVNKTGVVCYLCHVLDNSKRRSTIYGCAQCGKGFHVNCFTMYHFQNALIEHKPVLRRLIMDADGESSTRRQTKRGKYINTISNSTLPSI